MLAWIIVTTAVFAVIGILLWAMKDLSVETLSTISMVSFLCSMLGSCAG